MSRPPQSDDRPRRARPGSRTKPKRRIPSAPRLDLGQPSPDVVRIYGLHAGERALTNGARPIRRLLATDATASKLDVPLLRDKRVKQLMHMGLDADAARATNPLPDIEVVTAGQLDGALGAGTVHQGLLVEAETLAETDIAPLLDRVHEAQTSAAQNRAPLVIVLDHVTDPHNVGAVLRSAAAFGALGLVMTQRYSPTLGGALAKAATGALEDVPVSLVVNLADALDELRAGGLQVIGLEADGDGPLEECPFAGAGAVALVLGAEDRGLRQKTRSACDELRSISTAGNWTSLNVSNAAAIAMHWVRHAPTSGV